MKRNISFFYLAFWKQMPLLTFLLAFLAITSLCLGGEREYSEVSSHDIILSFADFLFKEGDYYRAITEYKRFLYYYPDEQRKDMVRLKIGLSYKNGKRWDDAIYVFKEMAEETPVTEVIKEAAIQIGEVYFDKRDYLSAINGYKAYIERYPDGEYAGYAMYRTAWSYLYLGDYIKAKDGFDTIPPQNQYHTPALKLGREIEIFDSLPQKSPFLAGTMSSLLPGSGQLYTGRYKDAITVMILNGIFLLGGIELVSGGHEVSGGILLSFELGWYGGNIFNAISNANKYNKDTYLHAIEILKMKYPEPRRDIARGSNIKSPIIIGLRWEF